MKRSQKCIYVVVTVCVLGVVLGLTIGLTLGLRRSTPSTSPSPALPPGHTPPTLPPSTTRGPYQSRLGEYRYAAVSTDATECSTIGVDILAKKRGSAVDAAIAAMICVGIMNFHSTGIGGGHFMNIYATPHGSSEKEIITIDAREAAPGGAHRDMFVNQTHLATKGGLAIGVPGEVHGFYTAWQKYGKISWSDLFTPSIRLCEEGHRITPSTARAIWSSRRHIRADPNLSELLMKNNSTLRQEGDIIRRPKMAETLRKIARDPFVFYNGSLAQDIVDDIKEYNGSITLEDLKNYTALVKDPLNVTLEYGNYTVYGNRPPSSGIIYAFILNILKHYKFNADSISTSEKKILTYHRIVEAWKFAYAKRSEIGDEMFLGDEFQNLLRNLTSDDYAANIWSSINDTHTQDVDYYGPSFGQVSDHGTAHLSVLAADGSAVAITSTINLYFGAKVRGTRTGIFFNNEMDDFSTPGTTNNFGVPASPANFIAPGKRPMSSMCPTIILNGNRDVVHISGAAGGTRITTETAFVTISNLWLGQSLVEAVDQPRLHHQLVPHEIRYELNFPLDIIEGLESKGHEAYPRPGYLAVVVPITDTCKLHQHNSTAQNCIHAVTDRRKPSAPDGY